MPTQDAHNATISLLTKYALHRLAGEEFTAADEQQLQAWLAENKGNQALLDRINDNRQVDEALVKIRYFADRTPTAIERFHRSVALPAKQSSTPLFRRLMAAAALLAVCSISYWLFRQVKPSDTPLPPAAVQADIDPGGNKAILTLADGSNIVLDSAGNGMLARQGRTTVIKVDDGQLAYKTIPGQPDVLSYNTVRTPNGGQYNLNLPDGSRVWLNAGSSLTFPTSFPDSARSVTLTGEAYFEVAANRAAPFTVKAASTSIEVLGTHFDIFAYAEDPAEKTTLLAGAIQVFYGAQSALLHPGQQAGADAKTGLTVTEDIDTAQAVAWKNGLFNFDKKDLHTVMREIARWYDVEIVYEGKVSDKILVGSLHRNTKLSMMLTLLGKIGVRCRMEGRTVYVSP